MITYCAIHLTTKRFYIGSTTDFKARYKGHTKKNNPYPFQRSLREDPNNFFWLISEDDGNEGREEEDFYLDFWYGHPLCWNLKKQAGGGFGWDHVNNRPDYVNSMTGKKHTAETIEKLKACKPKGSYSNKGRTPESRQVITMTNLDGRVETYPNWEWRGMGVRYDRAGIGRSHDKGWQFPHCPLGAATGLSHGT